MLSTNQKALNIDFMYFHFVHRIARTKSVDTRLQNGSAPSLQLQAGKQQQASDFNDFSATFKEQMMQVYCTALR